MHTNLDSLHMQFALPPKTFRAGRAQAAGRGRAELELTGVPPLGTLPGDAVGERGVFSATRTASRSGSAGELARRRSP